MALPCSRSTTVCIHTELCLGIATMLLWHQTIWIFLSRKDNRTAVTSATSVPVNMAGFLYCEFMLTQLEGSNKEKMCIMKGAWKHKLNKIKPTEIHFSNSALYAKSFWELGSKRIKTVADNEDRVFLTTNTFTYTNFLIHLLVIEKLGFCKDINCLFI